MVQRKVTVDFEGQKVDAFDVPIEESTERWTELRLEDGSVLRAKPVISAVHRIDAKKDPSGNPIYSITATIALSLVSGPTKLSAKKVQ